MTKITDKELLTFCNLTNLKMEYANLIEKRTIEKRYDSLGKLIDEKEILINHTIYLWVTKNMINY